MHFVYPWGSWRPTEPSKQAALWRCSAALRAQMEVWAWQGFAEGVCLRDGTAPRRVTFAGRRQRSLSSACQFGSEADVVSCPRCPPHSLPLCVGDAQRRFCICFRSAFRAAFPIPRIPPSFPSTGSLRPPHPQDPSVLPSHSNPTPCSWRWAGADVGCPSWVGACRNVSFLLQHTLLYFHPFSPPERRRFAVCGCVLSSSLPICSSPHRVPNARSCSLCAPQPTCQGGLL